MNPNDWYDEEQPQWAAAHEYMRLRGLVCASYSPGSEASYVREDDPDGPIVGSLSGSIQWDGSYSISVHGRQSRARRAQAELAWSSGEYVDLPEEKDTPWIFRAEWAGIEVACMSRDRTATVPFIPSEWNRCCPVEGRGRCGMRWTCWDGEGDQVEIEAETAEAAAVRYAERGDYLDQYDDSPDAVVRDGIYVGLPGRPHSVENQWDNAECLGVRITHQGVFNEERKT